MKGNISAATLNRLLTLGAVVRNLLSVAAEMFSFYSTALLTTLAHTSALGRSFSVRICSDEAFRPTYGTHLCIDLGIRVYLHIYSRT